MLTCSHAKNSRSTGFAALLVSLATFVSICLAGYVASAQQPSSDRPSEVSIEYLAENRVALVRAIQSEERIAWGVKEVNSKDDIAASGWHQLDALPIRIKSRDQGFQLSRTPGDDRIQVWVFRRDGDQWNYGVYGLQGDKESIAVDDPLTGSPINWPSRSAKQAIIYLLQTRGLEAPLAEEAANTVWTEWGIEGTRILFLLPAAEASRFPGVKLRPSAEVFCVQVEIDMSNSSGD